MVGWIRFNGPRLLKVLEGLGVSYKVVGRGEDSAGKFFNQTGVTVQTGGLAQALGKNKAPDLAIVAVGVNSWQVLHAF